MKKVVALLVSILFVVTLAQAVTLTIIQPEGTVTSTRPAGSRVIFKSLTEGIKWWKVTQGNVEVEDGGFTMPNEDVSVEAMYTGNLITVTQAEGGKIKPGTVGVNDGGSKTFTITPDDGYIVSDVLVDGVSAGARTSYEFTNVTAPHTITASYIKNSVSYTVYHYVENANDTNYTLADTKTKSGTNGAEIVLANEKLVMEGFTYKEGKLTEGGATVTTTTLAENGSTSIYLYYSRNTYTLTLAAGDNIEVIVGENGTETVISRNVKWGVELTFSAEIKEVNGYDVTFDKWQSSDTTLLPNQTTHDITFEMPQGDLTLVASATKTPITYTITYNLDGGTATGNPTSYTIESETIMLAMPTKTGYYFSTWIDEKSGTMSAVVTIPQGSTGNREYTAEWIMIVNSPVLVDGLTPVNWNGSAWETTTEANWDYNYNSVATATHSTVAGNGDGKWANAQTADGSLYVWIPRYSYKITSGEHSSGNSWNSLDAAGTNKIEVKFSNGTTDDTSNSYIAHPAFTFGEQELEGIWVAKYEASQGSVTTETAVPTSSTSVAKSIPGVASWRSITVSKMFDYAYNTYRNADSHLMKNVEWGAVAYLTNAIGRIPYINNSSDLITGNAGGTQDASQATGTINAWNTAGGVKASTTHNVYGIYDMSGGSWEYVAAYYTGGSNSYISSLTNAEDKYVDRYTTAYDSSKKGDAVYETSSSGSSSSGSWDEDSSGTFDSDHPAFKRGGLYGSVSYAGVFCFYNSYGYADSSHGFRVVLTGVEPVAPTTYTITYNLDGGTVTGNPATYTSNDTITLVNPTKDGYTFTGWTGSNGTTPSTTVTIPKGSTGNKTYTANWEVAWPGWNEPVLAEGLTPVNWNGSSWTATTEANWDYNYKSVATATHSTVAGNGNGKWANAQTADGSLYVWIPRYSYKITSGEHQSGKSWNSLDAAGTNKIEVKFSNGTTDDTSNSYIKHPAFTFGTDELEGIWVAKYEASQGSTTNETSAPTSSTSVAKSIPGVASWREITVSSMFDYAYNTYRNADSHLMKNVEWGAVAYLTNAIGRIPYINNSSDWITGNAGGSQNASRASGTTNAWNTANGVKASTTHNVYGIYDMSGGAWEYVAAYYTGGRSSYISSLTNAADKYVDRYSTAYSASKKGDAVYETSSSSSSSNGSWDGDYSNAPDSYGLVFRRGGRYDDDSDAGVFYFGSRDGDANPCYGFRVVLGIK